MAKSKKTKSCLTKAERFYVETNRETMTAKEMANELDVAVTQIETYINTLPSPKKRLYFNTNKGAVSMTPEQSCDDDIVSRETNKEFFKEHEPHIHKLRPNEPYQ